MIRADAVPLTGRTLGDFTVREKLGEGGNGVVYRAEQRGLGREAVVKILRARDASERVVARFLREAQLASKLDHPYAAHIYAFGAEPDGVMWIAMELVRGTPLSKLLAAQPNGRMPIARWVGLLDRVCEVVHTAHEQGIVHRDLKPDNIMVLSRAGRLLPKLLDLGVARLTIDPTEVDITTGVDGNDASRDVRLTQEGARVGSPFYMAPEQWRDGEVDARTDLYALGVMTYEALAGRVPFGGETVAEIARAHLKGGAPALPTDIPAALADIVSSALAEDRTRRPASALAFADAVRAASGLRVAADALPRLDDGLRADVAWLPQPIAEAIGAIEAARNPHQARDALWEIVHVAARWIGVVALAARSRTGPGPGCADAPAAVELLRTLHRRELTDEEWLELVRDLARPFASIRDAHPIPELVDLAMAEASPFAPLFALRAAELTGTSEESMREWLARTLPVLTPLVRALGFLTDYQLVVPHDGAAELWMGPRKPRRAMINVARDLPDGAPALVDVDGRPVLALAPLVAIAPPSPGAPDEVFLFAGPGRARGRGARLIAEPHGFERHDDAIWDWLRDHVLALDERDTSGADEAVPYRGLSAFTQDDADRFFGRERQAEAFLNQLLVAPLIAVVGPSGAGKSSFVHAGVLPLLPAGWRAITLRPGAAPVATFTTRVPVEAPDETVVIVIDQFEELFTLCGDPDERERFAHAVIDAASRERVRIVLTLRDDFLVRAAELMPLRDRLTRGLTLLATPAPDDLLRILVEPARRAGYDFDDSDLPSRMVRAVASQPGALALLSFTAAQLWELRDRHFKRLTRKAYDAIGGVEGALAAHADATLAACTAEEQRLVRDAFRHLVTAEGTRAVLTRADLDDVLGKSPRAHGVIERLVAARLLVASEDDRVEIIHEALISAWPRLVEWRRADAEGVRLRDQLRAAARQWADRDRPRGLLWRDDALDDYRRWRTRWTDALPELDEEFAATSLRDAARGRRLRRSLLAASATILVIGTLALALLYRSSSENARTAQDRLVASYEEQGRRLLLEGDYLRALPYLSAAYSAGDDAEPVRLMLHRAMKLADAPTFAGGALGAAFGDRDHAVIVDNSGAIRSWSLSRHRVDAQLDIAPADGPVIPDRITSRGRFVAVPMRSHVTVWDGAAAHTFPVADATHLAFDVGATRLAIATEHELSLWQVADSTLLWKMRVDGKPTQLVVVGDAIAALVTGKVTLVTPTSATDLGPGGRLGYGAPTEFSTLTADGVEVFDEKGALLHALVAPGPENSAISPDGKVVAVSSASGVISMFEIASGHSVGILSGHRNQARMAFTPDGQRLVSVGEDQTVRIWSVARPGELQQLSGTGSGATSISFDSDGKRVMVASEGGVRVLDLFDPSAIAVVDSGEPQGTGGFIADGHALFTTTDTAVETWDASTGRRLARFETGPADGTHFDAKGALLAVPLADTPATEIRDVATGAVRRHLKAAAPQTAAVFDHRGDRVIATRVDGVTDEWDLTGKHLFTLAGPRGTLMAATFDPSDRRIAIGGYDDRMVHLWDADTGRELAHVDAGEGVFSLAFDRSGDRLLAATDNRLATLYDAHTLRVVKSFEHETSVRGASLRPDGRLVAGATRDGLVSIWDVDSGKELFRFRHAQLVMSVDFSADGTRLLSTGRDDLAMVWDVSADVPDPVAVAAFIACHVPYALHGTSLDVAARQTCR